MNKEIKKIVELKIDESDVIFDGLGLEVVSLVEEPAIEVNWRAFQKEEFVEKQPGETKDEFIDRCMSKLVGDEGYESDQAYAICINKYETLNKEPEEVELKDITYDEYTFTVEDQKYVLSKAQELGETIGPDDIYLELKDEKFSTLSKILKGLSVINALTTWQAANDEGETFYRYGGRPAERNFCKALQRMNKVFSFDDIQQMEARGVNRDLGHKKQAYSIWDYKGGVNCYHSWYEVKIFKGTNNNKVIIDLGPVQGLPGTRPIDMPRQGHHPDYKFTKQQFSVNDEKRIVIGPLLIPNKFILRQDENGEPYYVYFSRETIRKVAEKFFKENKQNNTDINHDEVITNKNTLLESWIVEDTTHDKSYLYGFRLPKGTLMASYKINDEQTWSLIKEGKLNGFSIAGFFAEKSKKEKEQELTLKKIIELLNEVE